MYTTVESIYGVVDSGADWIIAPMDPAVDQLKLDLSQAPVRQFRGTTGRLQSGKLANISIIVLTEDGHQAFEKPSPCVFCETLNVAGGLLLGQDGFFSHFKTTFDQPNNYFEIEPWVSSDQ